MAYTLPETFAKLPRYSLTYPHPSPIHPLPGLTTYLHRTQHTTPTSQNRRTTKLYAKRDDHSSPLACAGNKYRKLEYIIPDILSPTPRYSDYPSNDGNSNTSSGRPTTLVTEGAVQSNHTVQVCSVAKRLGLEAVAILHKGTGGGLSSTTDEGAFLRAGNVQILRLLGAEICLLEKGSTAGGTKDPNAEVIEQIRARGGVPYWVPSGASLHPLGGLGYARCAIEIAAQERDVLGGDGARFGTVFAACGSGSMIAGLIAGFKLLEKMEGRPARKVIGIVISPTKPREWHEERVLRFARRAGELIGLDAEKDITMEDVRLDFRFTGTAYGVLDPEAAEAMGVMAREDAIILDPVYTAKVARGMMHWVQQGEIAPEDEENALFIHTGGQAALSAYADV